MSYPKCHLLYEDAIDAATLRLWLGQGEGFSVEFLDYPGQTTSMDLPTKAGGLLGPLEAVVAVGTVTLIKMATFGGEES